MRVRLGAGLCGEFPLHRKLGRRPIQLPKLLRAFLRQLQRRILHGNLSLSHGLRRGHEGQLPRTEWRYLRKIRGRHLPARSQADIIYLHSYRFAEVSGDTVTWGSSIAVPYPVSIKNSLTANQILIRGGAPTIYLGDSSSSESEFSLNLANLKSGYTRTNIEIADGAKPDKIQHKRLRRHRPARREQQLQVRQRFGFYRFHIGKPRHKPGKLASVCKTALRRFGRVQHLDFRARSRCAWTTPIRLTSRATPPS